MAACKVRQGLYTPVLFILVATYLGRASAQISRRRTSTSSRRRTNACNGKGYCEQWVDVNTGRIDASTNADTCMYGWAAVGETSVLRDLSEPINCPTLPCQPVSNS